MEVEMKNGMDLNSPQIEHIRASRSTETAPLLLQGRHLWLKGLKTHFFRPRDYSKLFFQTLTMEEELSPSLPASNGCHCSFALVYLFIFSSKQDFWENSGNILLLKQQTRKYTPFKDNLKIKKQNQVSQ